MAGETRFDRATVSPEGALPVSLPCPNCDAVSRVEGRRNGQGGWFVSWFCPDCSGWTALVIGLPPSAPDAE